MRFKAYFLIKGYWKVWVVLEPSCLDSHSQSLLRVPVPKNKFIVHQIYTLALKHLFGKPKYQLYSHVGPQGAVV